MKMTMLCAETNNRQSLGLLQKAQKSAKLNMETWRQGKTFGDPGDESER